MRCSSRPTATRHLLLGAALLTFLITGCGDSPVSSLSSGVDAEAQLKRGGGRWALKDTLSSTVEASSTDLTGGTSGDSGDSLVPGSGEVYQVLTREQRQRQNLVVRQLIGEEGGQIIITQAQMMVDFPAGAVSSPTWITVTVPKGNLLGYHFEPQGIQFARPVVVTQKLHGANATAEGLAALYFDGDLTEYVVPLELPPVVTWEEGSDLIVEFSIEHFSWYSIGRKRGGYIIATN